MTMDDLDERLAEMQGRPWIIMCGIGDCDEPAVSGHTTGLRGYCSRSHRVLAERRADALMCGEDPRDIEEADVSGAHRWDPASMGARIAGLRSRVLESR